MISHYREQYHIPIVICKLRMPENKQGNIVTRFSDINAAITYINDLAVDGVEISDPFFRPNVQCNFHYLYGTDQIFKREIFNAGL